MPACFNAINPSSFPQAGGMWLSGMRTTDLRQHSARYLAIGLVNNMPDGALESTERQFLSLLDAASGHLQIRLLRYSLPGICRKGDAASRVRMFYSGVENLWNTNLDGLIVTGREPLAPSLPEEPYWQAFTRVLDWARENTYSTVWSCLAAHAAVLYCDGIARRRSRSKHCGVFECVRVAEHPLAAGIGSKIQMPHSRWNGISEIALKSRGYRVLTRSTDAGVDSFIKDQGSLFVYFQGHPEYEDDTLKLEYRRDVARFLGGESKCYPAVPKNYFDDVTLAVLKELEKTAICRPRRELLAEVYGALLAAKVEPAWRPAAVSLYKNWLEHISARKQMQLQASGGVAKEPTKKGPTLVVLDEPIPSVASLPARNSKIVRQGRVAAGR